MCIQLRTSFVFRRLKIHKPPRKFIILLCQICDSSLPLYQLLPIYSKICNTRIEMGNSWFLHIPAIISCASICNKICFTNILFSLEIFLTAIIIRHGGLVPNFLHNFERRKVSLLAKSKFCKNSYVFKLQQIKYLCYIWV